MTLPLVDSPAQGAVPSAPARSRVSRFWLGGTALAILMSVTGCASNAAMQEWSRGVLAAERKLQHGEYKAALRDFQFLEESAMSRTDRVEMRMRQAEVYRRGQRFADAERVLTELEKGRDWVDREQLAKIVYLKGRVIDDSGAKRRADRYLMKAVNAFPKTAFGWRAWVFLKPRLQAQMSEDRFIELLRKMFKRHRDTPIGDNFLFEAAHLYYERNTEAGDRMARKLFEQFLDIWILETSGFWDDVVWELSLLHHRRGRFEDEERLLERLLSTRAPGWPGPSDIKYYKYAYMRIAKLYMFEYGKPEKAASLFQGYEKHYPFSRYRDDMLWWEGHAWKRAGRDGKARAAWDRLAKLYPESKYLRRLKNGYPAPTVESEIP